MISNDRRRFFRIEDWVYLETQLVIQSKLEQKLEYYRSGRHLHAPANEHNADRLDNLSDLKAIAQKMPKLARYLNRLQMQVDHITQSLLPSEKNDPQTAFRQTRKVNISAQGISYTTDELFKPVDTVEIHLTLIPTSKLLSILARVIMVEDNEENEADGELGLYRISLEYQYIDEDDREVIAKHVHNRQLSALGSNHGMARHPESDDHSSE